MFHTLSIIHAARDKATKLQHAEIKDPLEVASGIGADGLELPLGFRVMVGNDDGLSDGD